MSYLMNIVGNDWVGRGRYRVNRRMFVYVFGMGMGEGGGMSMGDLVGEKGIGGG